MDQQKYQDICRLWIKSDTWTLEDAISLIGQKPPSCFASLETKVDESEEYALTILRELVKNNLNGTLTLYPSIPGEPESTIRINPFDFLEWLEDIDPEQIPLALKVAKEDQKQINRGTTRRERPETIHRYRVAALAELFWREEPNLTKVEMSQKPELTEIGCNGKIYTYETIQKWIKESNPNREPGRRS